MSNLKHGTPNNPPMHLDCGMNYFVDYISPADAVSDSVVASAARGRVKFSTRTDAQKAAIYNGVLDDERIALGCTQKQMRDLVNNTVFSAATCTRAHMDPRTLKLEDGVYKSTKHVAASAEDADTSGSVGMSLYGAIGGELVE